MPRPLARVALGLGLALGATPAHALVLPSTDHESAPASAPARRVPGELVVLLPQADVAGRALRPPLAPDAAPPALARLDAALVPYGLQRSRWLAPDGRAVVVRSDDPSFDARAHDVARRLVADGVARAAAPNLLLDLQVTTPNDPYLATQWHLGTTAAGIRARNAWDLETGDSSVVIGVVDTGVDRTHPDLVGRIWINHGEVPGNLLDDDGNGYVDDVNGWDFAHDDNNPNPVFVVDSTAGMDVGWHGTFGAGLAAAVGNNAVGITGVAWDCRIMPLKVSGDSTGGITLAAVTEAFAYASDNGCSVLNLSLAGTDPILEGFFQPLVDDAFDAGIVCVAAAGNDGLDNAHYPAANESTLAVAATTQTNTRASFSSWGWYVDIAAPGANVWSSIAQNYTRDATHAFLFSFLFGWDGTNPYMYNSGTSFSTPIVAGAVALVRSKYPGVPPNLIIDHMIATADPVNYDNEIGGRLNVYNALLTNVDAPALPGGGRGPAALLGRAVPNPAFSGTSVAFTLPRPGPVALAVYDLRGRRVAGLVDGPRDAGAHHASWDGLDAGGRRVAPGLYFIAGSLAGERRSTRVTVLD
jgi:subtilisin family serine protease